MSDKKTNRDKLIHNRHFTPKDDLLIKQGDKGNSAYLIQSGRVRVYAEHNGKIVELGKLGVGDIVGEMALIVDEPRSANVQALENSNFVVVTRPMMIERLAKTDPLIKALVPMLMTRIKEGNKKALSKKHGLDEMMEAVTVIYENIHEALPAQKKRSLEKAVLPKMEEFMKAVENFRKLYGD